MRHTWFTRAAVVVSVVVAGSVAVDEPAVADLTVSCVGTASDVTVPFDLFVPAGKSCDLTNVVVNGSAMVRAGANLFLTGSTVNGALVVQSDGFASVARSSPVPARTVADPRRLCRSARPHHWTAAASPYSVPT